MNQEVKHHYEFGPFRLNAEERLLRRNGETISLPPKTLDLLMVLVESRGRLLEKGELMKWLWPDSFVEEANLSHHVFTLRRALNDGENGVSYIETVPRRGYRFVGSVNEISSAAAVRGSTLPPADGESASRLRTPSGRSLLLVAVAILAPTITLILTRGFWQGGRQQKPTSFPAIESLAVLPLGNLSNDPEQTYFVDGMTDALISQLGKIGALRVISSTSAMQYKETPKHLHEIAKELDVQAIVEGSVLRSRDRVRITVRLFEAATDRQLWAQSYDGDVQDVLALQSKVAADVAGEIKVAVTGQGIPFVRRKPVNPEAYNAYLKGHYHMRKRNKEAFRNALEFFERAIEKDPNYAPAYAGLADMYDLLAGYALLPPKEAYPKARAAAIEALRIDDQLAEAHTALAKVKARHDWDWQGAEIEFLRATELNPSYAPGHQWYGLFYLAATAQYDKAIAELEQAKRLDPLSLNINTELGLIFTWAGKHERAIELLQDTLEIDPDFSYTHAALGDTYFNKGMLEPAIEEFQKAAKLSQETLDGVYLSALGFAYGASGREQEARKVLGTLIELKHKQYVPSESIAEVHIGLGDKAGALEWLEKAYEERSRTFSLLKVRPEWDSLREEPKFQDLVRRIGLNP